MLRDKYSRYPVPVGRVATLEDEEVFPPDPEVLDVEPLEIEGLRCPEDPSYEPLPVGRALLLCVWRNGPFYMGLPSPQNLLSLA